MASLLGHAAKPRDPTAVKKRSPKGTMSPIKMHWWRGPEGSNFGDELSPVIVRAVSGRPVERAPIPHADMLGIGSILQAAARSPQLANRRDALHVWGTGIITPISFPDLPCLRVSAVRGPLTRNVLRLPTNLALGDPGLLADRLVERASSKEYAWGLIPHHSQVEEGFVQRVLAHTPRSALIDVRHPDCLTTVLKIAACDRIASTSLHGLIVADALKIPNIWISGREQRRSFSWKFTDYFLSVGRSEFQPFPIPASGNLDDITWSETDYFPLLDPLKAALVEAFPNLS